MTLTEYEILAVPILAGPAAISTVILLERCVVGLRCVDRSGKLHPLGSRCLKHQVDEIACTENYDWLVMGLLPAARAIQFLFNELMGEQGLLGRSLSWD